MDEKIKNPEEVEKFWRDFCEAEDVELETPHQVWSFGNSVEMAEELAELVLAGKKRATASLEWAYEEKSEAKPVLSGYSIVTDFEGNPKCVIRTTELAIVPFNEVDAEFAFDEGEGDQSLDYWRQEHWNFFSQNCIELDREPDQTMPVNCERFELLYPRNEQL